MNCAALIAFVGCLVASSCLVVRPTAAQATVFSKIDDYLTAHVTSDNVTENLQAAKDFQAQLEANSDLSLLDALNDFVALKDVGDDQQCLMYEVIRKNVQSTIGSVAMSHHKRRVDRIVLQVLHQHALNCRPKYPQIYQQLQDKVNQTLSEPIRAYLDELTQNRVDHFVAENTIREHLDFLGLWKFDQMRIGSSSVNGDGKATLRVLQQIAPEQTKEATSLAQVKQLIKEHLLPSCANYIYELSPILFEPAEFELSHLLWSGDLIETEPPSEEVAQLYQGLARAKLCGFLLEEDYLTAADEASRVARRQTQ